MTVVQFVNETAILIEYVDPAIAEIANQDHPAERAERKGRAFETSGRVELAPAGKASQ